ncbi:hypothetical protein [Beijerinckia mobilis]|uniref:hypothetical protein n=1 Tax=Beijerinckia mobilis TaxID=231434 RepID=UPI0012EB3E9E|nr:hypothetical protein [Beijerinckia mobilis]
MNEDFRIDRIGGNGGIIQNFENNIVLPTSHSCIAEQLLTAPDHPKNSWRFSG